MMAAVMDGEQRLGIAHLKPGYEKDYFGTPTYYKVFSAARVLFADRQPDGRWNIMVEGIQRVRMVEELQSEPFRTARVQPLLEFIPEFQADMARAAMLSLSDLTNQLSDYIGEGGRRLMNLAQIHQHPGIVADMIAHAIVADPYTRQSLLEEVDIVRRMRLVQIRVREALHLLSGKTNEQASTRDQASTETESDG
jgi:hypothetical protein